MHLKIYYVQQFIAGNITLLKKKPELCHDSFVCRIVTFDTAFSNAFFSDTFFRAAMWSFDRLCFFKSSFFGRFTDLPFVNMFCHICLSTRFTKKHASLQLQPSICCKPRRLYLSIICFNTTLTLIVGIVAAIMSPSVLGPLGLVTTN